MTTSGPSDEKLAYAAARGDNDAFDVLWRRHESRLRRRVTARLSVHVRRTWPVEDILQEVSLATWKVLRSNWRLAPMAPEHFRNLVNRISRFKELDALRYYYRHVQPAELQGGVAARQMSAEERLRYKDLKTRIAYLVVRLPEKERRAYILVVVKGLSCFEVSRIEGVTVRTIQRRVFDAKQKLIRWLGEWF